MYFIVGTLNCTFEGTSRIFVPCSMILNMVYLCIVAMCASTTSQDLYPTELGTARHFKSCMSNCSL